MDYQFWEELLETEWREDLEAMLRRGNHKSTKEGKAIINGLLQKNVS
jgi:hypothetical protein